VFLYAIKTIDAKKICSSYEKKFIQACISLLKRSKQNIKYKTNQAKFFKEAGELKTKK
jgi:hypothetical protein